jgi:hypothetical protein
VLVVAWALGSVAFESRHGPRARRSFFVLLAVGAVGVVPWLLPVLPAHTTVGNDAFPLGDDYGREVGWPQLAQQVATVWNALPAADRADAAVLGSNYGDAGAIAKWGQPLGLPAPVSGHLTWRWWGRASPGRPRTCWWWARTPTGCRHTVVARRRCSIGFARPMAW